MQAYDQAVVSASKIISQAITSDLNCVIDNGLELDDQITKFSIRSLCRKPLKLRMK